MHLFKHKKKSYNSNKKDSAIPTTIDDKHKNKLNELQEAYNKIPEYKKEIEILEKKYEELMNITNITDETIEERLSCKEKIDNLKKQIVKIEELHNKKEYELDACHLLFHYYNESEINNTVQQPKAKTSTNTLNNKKSILDFFSLKANKPATTETVVTVSNEVIKEPEITIKTKLSKGDIMDEYLSYIEPNYVKKIAYKTYYEEICSICNQHKIINMMESILICPNCGTEEKILVDSELPSYKEPPREVTYFAYKRINHFKEWLSQLQAKESTNIDKEVFDKIYSELNKEKYIDKSKLKTEHVLQILKKLGLSKYYEHCPYITNQISGRAPLNIDPETEEKAINMFKEVQGPWMKYGMNDRSNFFSYPYILYKFFQLLEKDEYLPELRLLKTREKLQEQDEVWKKICYELQWEFIRTV